MLMRFGGAACIRRLVVSLILGAFVPAAANAQGVSPNTGLLHISGGVDAPSLYVYRGVVQEGDPALTLTPWANLTICTSDTGRVCVETGVWIDRVAKASRFIETKLDHRLPSRYLQAPPLTF